MWLKLDKWPVSNTNFLTWWSWHPCWWQRGKPTRAHRDYGLLGYIYLVIYCHMASYGLRSEETGVYGWRGWVIPLRLLWQLEHLRCEQTALHGGGDALFGNRGTGQPVFAETLRVEDEMSHNAKIVTFDNIRLHTFGLTMYCPGFTVTSLQTSLVLHAGS